MGNDVTRESYRLSSKDCQRLEVSVVQWISVSACHAEDLGSIPSQEVILDVDNLINVESTTLFLLNQSVGKSLV